MLRLVIIFFIFTYSSSLKAQLSGAYIIGAQGDFSSLTIALNALSNQGMNGNVEFKLESNQYYNTYTIQNHTPQNNDTLTISSLAQHPDSVKFAFLNIYQSKNIYFNNLSFQNSYALTTDLVLINKSDNIHFTNCKLIDTVTSTYTGSTAVLRIIHNSNSPKTHVYIKDCKIEALTNSNNHPPIAIYTSGSGYTYFIGDSIIGEFNFHNLYYRSFTSTYFHTAEAFGSSGTSIIDSCEFHFYPNPYEYPSIRALNIRNTIFAGTILNKLDIYQANIIENCKFHLPIEMNHIYSTKFMNNKFYNTIGISFGNNLEISCNTFKEELTLALSTNLLIKNNFFLANVVVSSGDLINLFHNSFGITTNLYLNYTNNITIVNNIFNEIYCAPSSLKKIENNNYFGTSLNTFYISNYDSLARFYNPNYNSALDLHINNPVLIGSAKTLSFITNDIDYEPRAAKRSIGADEQCITSSLSDTIWVECGDKIVLKLCEQGNSLGYHWGPAIYLDDSSLVIPSIIADSIKTIYLIDSMGLYIDSTVLAPSPIHYYGPRTYYSTCGNTISIPTRLPLNASIHWFPDSLFTNPYINPALFYSEKSTTIIAEISTMGCGVYYDTIYMNINIAPSAGFNLDSNYCNRFNFSLNHSCYDSLSWDFGDGTSLKNSEIASHVYSNKGFYTVSLRVWNDTLNSYYSHVYFVGCLNIENIEENDDYIKIFPNPNNGSFTIDFLLPQSESTKLRIFNSLGQCMYSELIHKNIKNKSYHFDSYTTGIYLVQLSTNDRIVYNKKLIIH